MVDTITNTPNTTAKKALQDRKQKGGQLKRLHDLIDKALVALWALSDEADTVAEKKDFLYSSGGPNLLSAQAILAREEIKESLRRFPVG